MTLKQLKSLKAVIGDSDHSAELLPEQDSCQPMLLKEKVIRFTLLSLGNSKVKLLITI